MQKQIGRSIPEETTLSKVKPLHDAANELIADEQQTGTSLRAG